jgi:hypothetical protein
MTAISMVYSQWGFTIAADGRCKSDDPSMTERETEQAQKIFPVENDNVTLAYTLAGFALNEDGTFDMIAECKQQADMLLTRRFTNGDDYIHRFCLNLKRAIIKARRDGRISEFPRYEELPPEEQGRICRLQFAGYFRGTPLWIEVKFYHEEDTDRIRLRLNHHSLIRQVICTGSDQIANLMYGTDVTPDPRVSNYRKSPSDGDLEYTASFIRACSDPVASEIDPVCKSIGGHLHAAEVTQAGFRWLIPPKNN